MFVLLYHGCQGEGNCSCKIDAKILDMDIILFRFDLGLIGWGIFAYPLHVALEEKI